MEILIVGGIIVALMVYLSTKIKAGASQAYEPENFENNEFSISKPEGFIIPYNEKSRYAVEIYSKDYGDEAARKLKQCQALVSVENNYKKNSVFKNSQNDKGVATQTFTKLIGNKKLNRTYKLEVTVLDDYKERYDDKIKLMIDSFLLK